MRNRLLYTPAFDPTFDVVDSALRTFDRVLRNPSFVNPLNSAWSGTPDVKVETNEDGWLIRAELPGIAKDDLSVEALGNRLVIRAKRDNEVPEGFRAIRRERSSIAFERSFEFARGFDGDKINAELNDGVLVVSVPKREEERPRSISVN